MLDIDHKLSRQIVNTAIANDVTQINLENLKNIRSTINAYKKNYRKRYCKTRKSLKNSCDVNNWSFYRLAQFIEYKAKLAGIKVETVNPAYTSQTCPKCGKRNHANDRNYKCECGFHIHRDLLGAINICYSTEYVGGTKDDARHTCAED
jgi:IS605 OrfB family transposase